MKKQHSHYWNSYFYYYYYYIIKNIIKKLLLRLKEHETAFNEHETAKTFFQPFVICLFVHHLHPITTSSMTISIICAWHQTTAPFDTVILGI